MVYLSSFLQIQKLNTSYALVYAAWCIATMPDRQHQINKKKEKKKKEKIKLQKTNNKIKIYG